jgi:hypothetical protein
VADLHIDQLSFCINRELGMGFTFPQALLLPGHRVRSIKTALKPSVPGLLSSQSRSEQAGCTVKRKSTGIVIETGKAINMKGA